MGLYGFAQMLEYKGLRSGKELFNTFLCFRRAASFMQNGSGFSVDAELFDPDCAFCNHNEITHIMKETPRFLLAADHAPLVEGHILIIPKSHYTCYGDVPGALDEELLTLKSEVHHF